MFALRPRIITIAVGSAMACLSGVAGAAGFQLQEQGASGLGTAYSGQAAAANDASTVWWNPAGMSQLPGLQFTGAIDGIKPSTKFNNSGSTLPPFADTTKTGSGGDAGDWAAIPSLFATWQIAPAWTLGLGVNGPFGLTTDWDKDWIGRFWATKSSVETLNINPSVAWKVNNSLSLGAGVSYQQLKGEFRNFVNYAGAAVSVSCRGLSGAALAACAGAVLPALGGRNEGEAKIKGDDWSWGWNLGAMWDITPATRLGVTYRSAIKHTVEGDVTFDNRPTALNAALPNGGVQADVKLPAMASVALSHRFNNQLRVLADYTWTGWSSIKELKFVRNSGATLSSEKLEFDNSWRIGVGAEYQINQPWLLRFGVAYDTSPVQDTYRSPRLPDADRWWLSIGARWQATPAISVDLGYTYIFVDDPSSNLPYNAADAAAKGTLRGEYDANVNIIGAGVNVKF